MEDGGQRATSDDDSAEIPAGMSAALFIGAIVLSVVTLALLLVSQS